MRRRVRRSTSLTPHHPFFLQRPTSFASSPANFVQAQQTRARQLYVAAYSQCTSLFFLRNEFAAAVKQVQLVTSAALSPPDLGAAVERLWRDTLQDRGLSTANLVPGFGTNEPLAGATDLLSFMQFITPLTLPLQGIPLGSYPFSSRLPFSRADSVRGGSRVFVVTGETTGGADIPVLGGEARVRVDTAAFGNFPYAPADIDATPGFNPYDPAQNWVPLGDDFLSLLDACAEGLPLSIDVHNLRPMAVFGVAPTDMDPPYDIIALGPPPGLGADNPQRCAMGAPPPPPPPEGSPPTPQTVLFNAPLRCPPLLRWLGELRKNSTYSTFASRSRFTIAEWKQVFPDEASAFTPPANLTPEQADLATRTLDGDLGDRVRLLATLQIVAQGPNFTHNAQQHYARCAPSKCTTTSISERTVFQLVLEGFSILGGTAAAVMGVFAWIIWTASMVAQEFCGCTEPEEEPVEGGKDAAADGGSDKVLNVLHAVVTQKHDVPMKSAPSELELSAMSRPQGGIVPAPPQFSFTPVAPPQTVRAWGE